MMLALEEVTAGYEKAQVLEDVSLNLEEGEMIALVGPNGAGKTTTLRCVTGVIKPSSGRLMFKEEDLSSYTTPQIIGMGISYAPEGRDVFGNLSVYENLIMGGYKIDRKKELQSALQWIYELFPRLKERKGQLSASLSGGEQQMLTIGRALMGNPDLLLLDEPSLGLAPVLIESIYERIEEINQSGKTILLVEQNVDQALDVSNRGYVMENGQIRMEGESGKLLHDSYIEETYLGVA